MLFNQPLGFHVPAYYAALSSSYLTTLPAQELATHPNTSTECNGVCEAKHHSTLLVPSHLNIEAGVRISKLEEICAHTPSQASDGHRYGIANAGHESGEGETGKRFNEHCLVASLHAIEGVSILVVAGSCVEIRVLDVELFASLHHGLNFFKMDARRAGTEKQDLASEINIMQLRISKHVITRIHLLLP